MKSEREIAILPTEGKWFEIKPKAINQKIFEDKRKDKYQEITRRLIIEAFDVMKRNPEYQRNFKTMMPKKEWEFKIIPELKEMAGKLGDHNADWVEQALEWAQRIQNGENWEVICNEIDRANWRRLIIWKNGEVRLVGGSFYAVIRFPASFIDDFDFKGLGLDSAVPLIVSYDM